MTGDMCGRGGMHDRGMCGRGVHDRGHAWWGASMARETATAADGTHPTVSSCLHCILLPFLLLFSKTQK